MPLRSATDLMVLLLYAKGSTGKPNEEIRGITRIEKLMYLLMKEGGFQKIFSKEVTYEPYDFGPYSPEIYDILESLKEMDIVKAREAKISNLRDIIDIYYAEAEGLIEETIDNVMEIYSLTEERGSKVGKMLQERARTDELRKIQDLKTKYNGMKLDELLRYVYRAYPESAKRSKIIKDIIGFGKRPDLKPFVREEEM